MNAAAEIAVIIASHSRPGPLAAVLRSVELQRRDVALEVIVADNPSARSDEIAAVVAGFPGVTLVRLPRNVGFGRAINAGVARATAPVCYFACDDVLLTEGCLRALLAVHRTHPRAGLTAPVLLAADDPQRYRFSGGTHTWGLTPRLRIHTEPLPPTGCEPFAVTFVPGGALMIDRDLFLHLGAYRDDFFMYEEDTELCLRVRRLGRALTVVPAAQALDLGPPPTYDGELVRADKIRNLLATFTLHAPPALAPWVIAKCFASGILRLHGMPREDRRAWLNGWRRFVGALPALLRDRRRLELRARLTAASLVGPGLHR